ncbi:hypothetical protein EYF80_009835 [Liparis tanakae]|uniref:Uncharacterized protein n=1 Tax=Liparis tanakae TaxID=230148 RepID=A0A4Z2IQ41_9TELE|nr:hypothetical protein EYF80_009835 [Liparis tanakae]
MESLHLDAQGLEEPLSGGRRTNTELDDDNWLTGGTCDPQDTPKCEISQSQTTESISLKDRGSAYAYLSQE